MINNILFVLIERAKGNKEPKHIIRKDNKRIRMRGRVKMRMVILGPPRDWAVFYSHNLQPCKALSLFPFCFLIVKLLCARKEEHGNAARNRKVERQQRKETRERRRKEEEERREERRI